MRKYTVTEIKPSSEIDWPVGAEFMHNGRLHRRTRVGNAIFDHDISSERTTEMVDEFVAGSRLSDKEYYKKYGV